MSFFFFFFFKRNIWFFLLKCLYQAFFSLYLAFLEHLFFICRCGWALFVAGGGPLPRQRDGWTNHPGRDGQDSKRRSLRRQPSRPQLPGGGHASVLLGSGYVHSRRRLLLATATATATATARPAGAGAGAGWLLCVPLVLPSACITSCSYIHIYFEVYIIYV